VSGTQTSMISSAGGDRGTLRLLCPQWQGAGTSSVQALASEFPFDVARRGYAVGSAVLEAILPPSDGPTAIVPIAPATPLPSAPGSVGDVVPVSWMGVR
jgi:hypothetical protein